PDAMTITILEATATSSPAIALTDALAARLAAMRRDDRRSPFHPDAMVAGACFLLAMRDGEAVGCGALRPLGLAGRADVGEIKRMYAQVAGCGIGSAVLRALEERARAFDYRTLVLATRVVNQAAMAFYRRHGYAVCDNYGPYVGRQESVCFEKQLASRR
ncbi:MAG: histone acetyltransferase, partial [Massilia sp.]|nr:histone acetyltransferase [Massilia sp.]